MATGLEFVQGTLSDEQFLTISSSNIVPNGSYKFGFAAVYGCYKLQLAIYKTALYNLKKEKSHGKKETGFSGISSVVESI